MNETVRFALRHALITTEHTLQDWWRDPFESVDLLTLPLDNGSDDRTATSFRAYHLLDVGTTLDDIMHGAREGDFPHGRKLFTFKPVLDSGGHLGMCVYDCPKERS